VVLLAAVELNDAVLDLVRTSNHRLLVQVRVTKNEISPYKLPDTVAGMVF
jgi:hypothetical protein